MDTLPIKLNFFKRAEQFLELLRLDNQFELSMDNFGIDEMKKNIPSSSVNVNLPIWNIEKKILRWTYLHHKHLGSPVTLAHLKDKKFQGDILCDNTEITVAGLSETLDNLVAHGFATGDAQKGILFNSDGLLVGSLLYESYKPSNAQVKDIKYIVLKPILNKKFGYLAIYYSAWLLILYSIIFLLFQLFQLTGTLDDLKLFALTILPKSFVLHLIFLPLYTLIFGFILLEIRLFNK